MKKKIVIPADVPNQKEQEYTDNYHKITRGTDNIFLFAGDQKLEHLNADFYGPTIHPDAQDPEHLFNIASQGRIGAFATHLGLITRYARRYKTVNYLVKLNGKTDCIPTSQRDPISTALWTVDNVVTFRKNSDLSICGVGYTIYLGSLYETEMLEQAAQMIFQAHQHGFVAGLWIYPRGVNIKNDIDPQLIAGAAGVAAQLGADFVKIKAPSDVHDLKMIVAAAGNTKVICSGGPRIDSKQFLQNVRDQLSIGGVAGCAVGRNIFQLSLKEALSLTTSIASLVFTQDQENK
jgi:fructose-bisphosphate aldolase/6-deoxy-5-ketofructose 1-phosphate synthase